MSYEHVKRGILWISQLLKTLFIFWLKNLNETPAVCRFIIKKAIAIPKFMERNVNTEEHQKDFDTVLNETADIYENLKKQFNSKQTNSYKKLENKLSSKSQIFYFLIRHLKPNIVVETGVAAGESTGYILKALNDNKKGKLYSIDLPFQWYIYGSHELHLDSLPAGKMPGYLVPKKLKKRWHLILGDTYQETEPLLKKLKSVDVFLHDSEHTYKTMTYEYNMAWPHIKKGGLLLSDDVEFNKAFKDFSKVKSITGIVFKDIGILLKK